jgi:hypothetical protein
MAEVAKAGHEIALHGYSHEVYSLWLQKGRRWTDII